MSDCLYYCRMDLHIPAGKLLFVYLMPQHAYWVHTLNITMSNQLLMPREFVPHHTLLTDP